MNESEAEFTSSYTIPDSSGYGNYAYDQNYASYGHNPNVNLLTAGQPGLPNLGTSFNFDYDFMAGRSIGGTQLLGGVGATQFNALNFTIQAWINTTQKTPTGSYAFLGNGLIEDGTGGYAFALSELNNSIAFGIDSPYEVEEDYSIFATVPINAGKWHDIVATRQISASGISTTDVYIDGALAAAGSISNPYALLNETDANTHVWFGQGGRDFLGDMGQVALYNSVLSPQVIASQYVSAFATPEPAPFGVIGLGLLGLMIRRRNRPRRPANAPPSGPPEAPCR